MRLLPLLLAALVIGCDTPPADDLAPPRPRGDRTLALDVTAADGEDFDRAVTAARDLGATALSLTQAWAILETAPGQFAPETDFLDIANTYYPTRDMAVALKLPSVDTNVDQRPADLRDTPWDAPEMAARYRALLTYAASRTPDLDVSHVVLGNEVDIFFGDDRAGHAAYRTFIASVIDHARGLWPEAVVGTVVTFDGATGLRADEAAAIQALGDAALVTYYPLDDGFQVREADTVGRDVARLLDRLGGEVHLMEAGTPTGRETDGSEADQADFVEALFDAWDAHANRVPYLSYSFLTDFPEASVSEFEAYYGISDPAFLSYLGTLGLRTASGQEKPAYEVFATEAAARGW